MGKPNLGVLKKKLPDPDRPKKTTGFSVFGRFLPSFGSGTRKKLVFGSVSGGWNFKCSEPKLNGLSRTELNRLCKPRVFFIIYILH